MDVAEIIALIIVTPIAMAPMIPIAAGMGVEKMKGVQSDLSEKTKNKILQEGIYHFTSKENAEKIIQTGFISPTNGKLGNHFSESRYQDEYADYVYAFAGKPDLMGYIKNLSHRLFDKSDGTVYAIKYKPDKFELENHTERFQDGAITYEGRLDLGTCEHKIVRMKLERGKLIEVPLDEKINANILETNRLIKGTTGLTLTISSVVVDLLTSYRCLTPRFRQLIQQRRIENRLLRQINNEKERWKYIVKHDGVEYVVSTGNDKYVDGKVLSEFTVSREDSDIVTRVYTDQMDPSTFSGDKVNKFFEHSINFDTELDQYIGRLSIKKGQPIYEVDREFQEHFSKKQEVKAKTQPIYDRLMEQKSKKQLSTFSKIFKSTPARLRKEAQDFIEQLAVRERENKDIKNKKSKGKEAGREDRV